MKVYGNDRGAITLAVLAPIVAAVIGGAAAVGAAIQIVHLVPSQGSASQVSNQDVHYGDH